MSAKREHPRAPQARPQQRRPTAMEPWKRRAYDTRGRCLCLVCRTRRRTIDGECDCLLCASPHTMTDEGLRILHGSLMKSGWFWEDTLFLRELEDLVFAQRYAFEAWLEIGRKLQLIASTPEETGVIHLPASAARGDDGASTARGSEEQGSSSSGSASAKGKGKEE